MLVDAPCSGLGTLRRNPDLKWRLSAKAIDELCELQAKILESACRLLKSGGRLVYATCSPLRREDEAIAEAFSAAHPEFKLLDAGELLSGRGRRTRPGTQRRRLHAQLAARPRHGRILRGGLAKGLIRGTVIRRAFAG